MAPIAAGPDLGGDLLSETRALLGDRAGVEVSQRAANLRLRHPLKDSPTRMRSNQLGFGPERLGSSYTAARRPLPSRRGCG